MAGVPEEGLPYLVMDYVDGRPIDAWCDEHRLNVSERLTLFRAVCAAVQHAHQRLVLHRDIKPAHILVTLNGDVKLLDFGIAKLFADDGLARTLPANRDRDADHDAGVRQPGTGQRRRGSHRK